MFTTHHTLVAQNTIAMHDVCWTADDQPATGIRTSTLASTELQIIWQSGYKSTCYAGRHRHGTHPISHRVTPTAYTDSCLPLTMKLVNSFCIFLNLSSAALYLNMSIMHLLSVFSLAQGAVGCSTRIIWSGIIQRSGTCIGREQAPDRVLPVVSPTRLAKSLL